MSQGFVSVIDLIEYCVWTELVETMLFYSVTESVSYRAIRQVKRDQPSPFFFFNNALCSCWNQLFTTIEIKIWKSGYLVFELFYFV